MSCGPRSSLTRRTTPGPHSASNLARNAALVGVSVLLVVAGACSAATTGTGRSPIASTGASEETTAGPSTALSAPVPKLAPPSPISWAACPTDGRIQCGTVPVPLDYHHPTGPALTIAVTRMPATGSGGRGTLVINPGGPGESGNVILPVLADILSSDIRSSFDLVSFDPRGSGGSAPLDCGTDPAAITSTVPLPARPGEQLPGTPVFTSMARSCAARHPAETPAIDTINTARDIDRIRQGLGLSAISYYGLSYGTELGAVYAKLFPTHVSTMVLDGAMDVNASLSTQATEQAPAAEAALLHLLRSCPTARRCGLGADPVASYTDLMTSLTAQPLPAPGGGDAAAVTVGDLDTAALLAVSVPGTQGQFFDALGASARGDGGPLRTMALSSLADGDGSSLVDAQWATICNDAAAHLSPKAAGQLARRLAASWPLMGAAGVNADLGGCVAWPTPRQPVAGVTVTGVPPVLVIGTTGDPSTPFVGATHLAADISRSTLLTWDGWGHTWLISGPDNACMQADVSRYLLDGITPPTGTVCH